EHHPHTLDQLLSVTVFNPCNARRLPAYTGVCLQVLLLFFIYSSPWSIPFCPPQMLRATAIRRWRSRLMDTPRKSRSDGSPTAKRVLDWSLGVHHSCTAHDFHRKTDGPSLVPEGL